MVHVEPAPWTWLQSVGCCAGCRFGSQQRCRSNRTCLVGHIACPELWHLISHCTALHPPQAVLASTKEGEIAGKPRRTIGAGVAKFGGEVSGEASSRRTDTTYIRTFILMG